MKFLSLVTACLATFLFIAGCGGGDGTTVIQPTEDYQPTAEEQQMQAEMDAAREGASQ